MLNVFLYVVFIIIFVCIVLVFSVKRKRYGRSTIISRDFKTTWMLVIFSIITGIIATEIVGKNAVKRERSKIEQIGNVAAAAINTQRLKNLKGSLDDLKSPDYKRVRQQLIAIQKSTSGIRWLYLMGQNDSGIVFTVDNVPVDVYGHVEPGQGYYEQPPPELSRVFQNGHSQTVGPYSDEWGVFVSCFAAISDSATNKVVMVLGVDIDSSDWHLILFKARIVPLLITLLLVIIILLFSLERDRILKSNKELLSLQNDLLCKNKEIIEYTHTITHDLKKPVTGLKTVIEIVKMGLASPAEMARERLLELCAAGESSIILMQRMLEDLLVAAKLEWGGYEVLAEETDLREYSLELLKRYSVDLEKNKVNLTIEGDGTTKIDRKNFEIVFSNLVGNALTYGCDANEPKIDIFFNIKEGKVTIKVRDNGRGVPEADRLYIFDRFRRGSNIGGISGTGLGLYICKMAAKKMGGDLFLTCPEVGGAEFVWQFDQLI